MANFIPKPYKTEQVTIRLPLERLSAVDDLAVRYNLSRSAFINQCVEYALDNLQEMELREEGEGARGRCPG